MSLEFFQMSRLSRQWLITHSPEDAGGQALQIKALSRRNALEKLKNYFTEAVELGNSWLRSDTVLIVQDSKNHTYQISYEGEGQARPPQYTPDPGGPSHTLQ